MEIRRDDQILTVSLDESILFLGTLSELEDSEFGMVTWLLAEDINRKIRKMNQKDK